MVVEDSIIGREFTLNSLSSVDISKDDSECDPGPCLSYQPGGAIAYELLHRSINRQIANRVTKNDANLALSPTVCYVSIESQL
ncbi:hypothetical protein TNCV_3717461 [Trichonephila clavipes]|nr:hypothetical protein TNCV_3717461 [Trichonephila clavipes]